MKKLLILLACLPVFGIGQVGQWNSADGIIYPNDSTGKIVLGVGDTLYLINVDTADANASINYINRRSLVEVVYDVNFDATMDTVRAACLFQNIDFDSLMYFKIDEKTLNADSTLNLPQRITEIETYATATDRVSYFGVPFELTAGMIIVPDEAGTVVGAIAAASATDTILLKTGNYVETASTNKTLTVIGVGASAIVPVTGIPWYSYGGVLTMSNLKLKSNNTFGVRTTITGASNCNFTNCDIEGTSNFYNTSADADTLRISNCIIKGRIEWNGNSVIATECYLKKSTYNILLYKKHVGYYNYYETPTTSGVFLTNNSSLFSETGTTLNGTIFSGQSALSDYDVNFSKCEFITSGVYSLNINVSTYVTNCTIDSCNFNYKNYLADGSLFYFRNKGDITFSNCTSENLVQLAIRGDGYGPDYTFTIDNCNFQSTNEYSINIEDYNFNIYNNIFDSDTAAYITLYGEDYKISGNCNNNFVNQKQNTAPHIIRIGIETETVKTVNVNCTGNKLYGCENNGVTSTGTHGLWFFGGDSVNFTYNRVSGVFLGLVVKNRGKYSDDCVFSYNLIDKCGGVAVVRGSPGAVITNNTLIMSNGYLGYCIQMDEDPSWPGTFSDSCIIYNNIFYNDNEGSFNIIFKEDEDTVGVNLSNNLYYSQNDTNWFSIEGSNISRVVWAENLEATYWSTDPLLDVNGVPQAGSDAIGNGYNLGSPYNIGLTPSATFPDPATTTQLALWSIGAYIVPLNRTITSDLKIIRSGNLLIRY